MEATPREVRTYVKKDGKNPFIIWINSLKDSNVEGKVLKRIERLKKGNFGDIKSVGNGVFELRIDGGPGYRV